MSVQTLSPENCFEIETNTVSRSCQGGHYRGESTVHFKIHHRIHPEISEQAKEAGCGKVEK
jgi:hypothetical protein